MIRLSCIDWMEERKLSLEKFITNSIHSLMDTTNLYEAASLRHQQIGQGAHIWTGGHYGFGLISFIYLTQGCIAMQAGQLVPCCGH